MGTETLAAAAEAHIGAVRASVGWTRQCREQQESRRRRLEEEQGRLQEGVLRAEALVAAAREEEEAASREEETARCAVPRSIAEVRRLKVELGDVEWELAQQAEREEASARAVEAAQSAQPPDAAEPIASRACNAKVRLNGNEKRIHVTPRDFELAEEIDAAFAGLCDADVEVLEQGAA